MGKKIGKIIEKKMGKMGKKRGGGRKIEWKKWGEKEKKKGKKPPGR